MVLCHFTRRLHDERGTGKSNRNDPARGARLIHSDEELAEYTKTLFKLTAKADPSRDEEEAIELLTLLIERYEAERYPVPDADPIDALRFLLDQNGLSQRDIAPVLGGESTVSLISSGKRRLNQPRWFNNEADAVYH